MIPIDVLQRIGHPEDQPVRACDTVAAVDEDIEPDPVFPRPRSREVVQLGRQGQQGGAPRRELGQK